MGWSTRATSIGTRSPGSVLSGFARRRAAHSCGASPRRLCHRQQAPASQVQIHQPASHEQPVGILRQPAVPHFGPPKDPLDHQEHMFNFRADLRLRSIAGALRLAQGPMAMGFRLDEVLGTGGVLPNHIASPHTRVSCPCSRSGNTWLSCTFAAVAATEWISLVRLSTPRWAFMPKYHWLPFFV